MKRNLDLQVRILQLLEKEDKIQSVEGHSQKEFWYNARQLHAKELITILNAATLTNRHACIANGLTPQGHDFLEKNKNKWRDLLKSAGTSVGKTGGQVTLASVIREALEKLFSLACGLTSL